MIVQGSQTRGPKAIQDGATATGDGTALDIVTPGNGSFRDIAVQVVITGGTATVQFEVTLDGTNWVSLMMISAADLSEAASASANGAFRQSVWGFEQFRARISALSGATVTVTANLVA